MNDVNQQFNLDAVTYLVRTICFSAHLLVQEGTGWRFQFQTPIAGLNVNQVYGTEQAAITALIQAVIKTHAQKAA